MSEYVKDTSKKIKRAIGARQKEGTLVTQPPFGYCRDAKDKTVLKIVPKEAESVKLVYDLYLSGSGYRKIAAYLTEQGVPTPSMARRERELAEGRVSKKRIATEWSDSMIKDLLDNDFYIGTFRLKKRSRNTVHGKDKRVPKDEQCIFENHHPAIIDRGDLFAGAGAEGEAQPHQLPRQPWPVAWIGDSESLWQLPVLQGLRKPPDTH